MGQKDIINLYSFRRCPYDMRARFALQLASISYHRIEVSLKDKPEDLLRISPKGTVPVMQYKDLILDESLDIIYWALEKNDPKNVLPCDPEMIKISEEIIHRNDTAFKYSLDRYKYPTRYLAEGTEGAIKEQAMNKCIEILRFFEQSLRTHEYLLTNQYTLADICTFPFVRQFHHVNKEVMPNEGLNKTMNWLNRFLESVDFEIIMQK